jgi:carbonic anhydrase
MKKFLVLFMSVVALGLLQSCDTKRDENSGHKTTHSEKDKHWSYNGETGPEHWDELEKNSHCNGKRQSPINIIDINTKVDSSLSSKIDIRYAENTKIHDVANNGHSIQYNFEPGDELVFNNKKYDLKQIHFHEPAEHTINGIRYPMEIHLVHQNENKEFVVLGILAKEGIPSDPFTFLESFLPIRTGETKVVDKSFDLNKNLPENKTFYHYHGSLTTPPCTEKVEWVVFETPITISENQVKVLQDLMPINNYRSTQELEGRMVLKSM